MLLEEGLLCVQCVSFQIKNESRFPRKFSFKKCRLIPLGYESRRVEEMQVRSAKLLQSVMFNTFATPWTVACHPPLSVQFPRQETGVGFHFLLQGSSQPRDQ